jgi:hypothetical protein
LSKRVDCLAEKRCQYGAPSGSSLHQRKVPHSRGHHREC